MLNFSPIKEKNLTWYTSSRILDCHWWIQTWAQ